MDTSRPDGNFISDEPFFIAFAHLQRIPVYFDA
jgi:hypothetical protein